MTNQETNERRTGGAFKFFEWIKVVYKFVFLLLTIIFVIGFIGLIFGNKPSVEAEYRNIKISSLPLYVWRADEKRWVDYYSEDASSYIEGFTSFDNDVYKIAYIKLKGEITDECVWPFLGNQPVGICASFVNSFFNYVLVSDDIIALIVELDTPGGTQYGADILFQALYKLRQKKPVYIFVPNQIASGGVYMAVGASKIFASPIALIGNIGVMATLVDYSGLMNKLGIRTITFTSKNAKHKTLEGLLDEDKNDVEDRYFQDILDNAEARFHEVLVKGRPQIKLDQVKSGLIFTPSKAKELGLIDDIALNSFEVLTKLAEDETVRGYLEDKNKKVVVKQYSLSAKEGLFSLFTRSYLQFFLKGTYKTLTPKVVFR